MKKFLTSLLAGSLLTSATLFGALQINEIRTDAPGSLGSFDANEYFELTGDPGESLDGVWYIVIGDHSGSGASLGAGTIEFALDLTGFSIPSDGIFLCVRPEYDFSLLADADYVPGGFEFENSDNTTHLLVRGYTGIEVIFQVDQQGDLGVDIDDDDDGVVNTNLPWTEIIDGVSFVEDPTGDGTKPNYAVSLGVPGIGPDGSNVPGHLYRASDTGEWFIGEFDDDVEDGAQDTPGAVNPLAPTDPVIESFSPLAAAIGDTVTISGSRFNGVTGLTVNATVVANFTVVDANSITFEVPADLTNGVIEVTKGTEEDTFTTEAGIFIFPENTIALFREEFTGNQFGEMITVSVASDFNWDVSGEAATISGFDFGDSGVASDDWLITPAIDLSGVESATLLFNNWKDFGGPDLAIQISTDYSGTGDPTAATWTNITSSIALSTGFGAVTPSGLIDLSAYLGSTIYIAFQYTSEGSDSGQAANWSVDDITVMVPGEAPAESIFSAYALTDVWRTVPFGFIYDELYPFVYFTSDLGDVGNSALDQWLFVLPFTEGDDSAWYFYAFTGEFWGYTGSAGLYSFAADTQYYFEWDGTEWTPLAFP